MASYMGHEYDDSATTYAEARGGKQGKYRVGDRVRHKTVHAAGTGTVEELKPQSHYLVRWSSAYQLCTDPEDALLPAFRLGDRVKLNKHSGVRACGERGTVSAVIGDNVSVRMDDASAYGTVVAFFHTDNLDWERVEDCPVKAEPKFKAGDRVTYVPGADMDGHFMTIKSFRGDYHEPAYWFEEGGFDVERLLMLAAPCPQDNEQHGDPLWRVRIDTSGYISGISLPQPCIVALVKNGKPRPSQWPHVHTDVASATKEAERLARNNPGQEFAVYQRVAGRVAEVQMKEVA